MKERDGGRGREREERERQRERGEEREREGDRKEEERERGLMFWFSLVSGSAPFIVRDGGKEVVAEGAL